MRTYLAAIAGIAAGSFLALSGGCQTAEPSSALRKSLPALRQGYHWEVFDEVGVAVPCPNGWHRAVSHGLGTFTGSLSVEDFKAKGSFKTGFTVQVIRGVKQRTGKSASALAAAFRQAILKAPENKILAKNEPTDNGRFQTCIIRFRNSPAHGDKITIHEFFVASDRFDLLYIYTFESPNETWDEAFKNYGRPMMALIRMEQEL